MRRFFKYLTISNHTLLHTQISYMLKHLFNALAYAVRYFE